MVAQIPYCNVIDINRRVKRLEGGFTDTSKVTVQDVKNMIDEVSIIIDGELRGMGVSIPISNAAKKSLAVLKTLASLETASWAESAVFFGSNKTESTHAERLHERYEALLNAIKLNPAGMLPDVVTGSINHMRSSTEDMNKGGTKHGEEVFSKEHIDDFVNDNKIPSASEDVSNYEITGNIKLKI